MCKRGRVSQEDDSDQPFKNLREKVSNSKIQNCEVKIIQTRSFQKGDHSNADKKIIQIQEKGEISKEDFVKKDIHKRWYIHERKGHP